MTGLASLRGRQVQTASRYGLTRPGGSAVVPAPFRPGIPGGSPPKAVVKLADLESDLPEDISETLKHLVAILVVDDSTSMYLPGADTDGGRYAAARAICRLLAHHEAGRVGVIHFGSQVEEVLEPVDVTRNRRKLEGTLKSPMAAGGTNIAAAIDRAADLVDRLGPQDEPIVILLSDGGDNASDPVTGLSARLQLAIHRLPAGSLNVLLIDRTGHCEPGLRQAWTHQPVELQVLDTDDPGQLATQLASFVATSTGLRLADNPIKEMK